MPAADCQGSTSSSSFGFHILGRRRDQIHFPHEITSGNEVESFQTQVAQRFHDLAASDDEDLLSIPWIRKLLDAFICCQEEFRVIVFNNKGQFSKSPMDRLISDFFDRSVKALDVCNAIRDGIEQMRRWQKHLEIVLCALDARRSTGEGKFRRARKALNDLAIGMYSEKEADTSSSLALRNRSFGRTNAVREKRSLSHFRSLSWSVSRSWSAARQLQAIGCNLVAPRTNEIVSTNGLNVAVFGMNHVLLFVMWALVAAIPCQDRGLHVQHPAVTRQFIWAAPILSLHERILEESRKGDRKNICGLLKEIHGIEKCTRQVNELLDGVRFPLTDEKEAELKGRVQELASVYEAMKDGLDPLERRVREVFHRIVRCRTEGLDSSSRANSHNR